MVKALLGIDGGGTKTHAVVTDLEGKVLGTAVNGGANWERIGVSAVQVSLTDVIARAISVAGLGVEDISESTFALAGIDWDEDKEIFAQMISTLKFGGPTHLMNDSFAALFAGIPDGIGIVSIAGTGGKTTGRDGFNTVQTMGMDLGEAGGAGQLLALCLESIARMHHGILTKTQIYDAIPSSLGFNNKVEFFTAIARDRINFDESLAPMIFELANNGDATAIENVTKVAQQHALDVFGVASRLDFKGTQIHVVRAGGLHTAGCQIFDESFEREVKRLLPTSLTHLLTIPPVFGAVLAAAHSHFESVPDKFSAHLLAQAGKVILQ